MVDLVIGHKLNRSIGKHSNQSRGVALEKSPPSTLLINIRAGTKCPAPGTGILLKVRIRGLEKDLDSV